MGNQPPQLPPRLHGAECLGNLAQYLGKGVVQHEGPEGRAVGRTLDARAGDNTSYVLVHVYLVPGDVTGRLELRNAIHEELVGRRGAEQLHDLAYAVPTNLMDGRATAEDTWNRLIAAGFAALPGDREAWDVGDILYVHYWTEDGPAVLAGAPQADQRLPQAAEE